MNSTEHLGLNQWEAEDRILRTDFNSDNAKIDAALAGASRFVKLKEIVTTEDVSNGIVEVDLSDIPFADWQAVHVDIKIIGGSQVTFYVNNTASNCQCYMITSSSYSTGRMGHFSGEQLNCFGQRISFQPGRQGDRRVTCLSGMEFGVCTTALFQALTSMQFAGTLKTGTTIIIWGEG